MTDEIKVKKTPSYLFILLAITIVYLLIEASFNAALLNVASDSVSIETIESIEHWGRMISGFALALAICGTFIIPHLYKKNVSIFNYIFFCSSVSCVIIALVYIGQEKLIEHLVQKSTAEERKVAALVSIASGQLKDGILTVQGLDLSDESKKSPSSKTFIATFTSMISFLPHAQKIIEDNLDALIRLHITKHIGSADEMYYGSYSKFIEEVEEAFKEYGKAIHNFKNDVPLDTLIIATEQWIEYLKSLKKIVKKLNQIKSYQHERIRKEVKKSGLNVPDNWDPRDSKTFMEVCRSQYYYEAEAKLQEGLSQAISQKLAVNKNNNNYSSDRVPLNINTFEKFIAYDKVQKAWRISFNVSQNIELKLFKTLQEFNEKIYIPMFNEFTIKQRQILLSDTKDFADGEENEIIGKNAIEGSIVPPIALAFSLFGVIIHLCKTSFYSFRLFCKTPLAVGINIIFFVALMALPFYITTPTTSTEIYKKIESEIEKDSRFLSFTYKWVLHSQSIIYPVGEIIRKDIFQDIDFGAKK